MSTERDAGLQALQQGNPAAAAPLLETACQQNPADFDALLFLGAAYGQIGRQMDAINTITKAVQVQPANAQARYNLAVAMEQGGYRDQAITALGQALTLQPDYPKAQEALRRLQGGETLTGTGGGSMGSGSMGSGAAPSYGQGAPPSGQAQPGYGQSAEPSGLPQPGFGRVVENQPPAYSPPGGGYGQPAGGQGLNQNQGGAPGYGQQQPQYGAPAANPYVPQQGGPNPYAAQQPPANPYAQPGTPNPYAPQPGTSTYPVAQGQGPYPYSANPGAVGGVMAQVFNPEYAGFGARFAAALLDGIILLISGLVVGFAVGIVAGVSMAASGARPDEIARTIQPFTTVIGIVINWLYYALFESSVKQGTPGKQALGIMVTDLDGNRIGFGRASGRFFAKYISAFILCIGFIMAAFTERKQALHDMIASTLVVKR